MCRKRYFKRGAGSCEQTAVDLSEFLSSEHFLGTSLGYFYESTGAGLGMLGQLLCPLVGELKANYSQIL